MKISLANTLAKLPLPATREWPQGMWDVAALERGEMTLLLFAPRHEDYQTPHSQDEVYIVVRGSGTFLVEDEPFEFDTGDVLFVPARKPHRFIRFTDDLAMWVVFWGPHHGKPEGARNE